MVTVMPYQRYDHLRLMKIILPEKRYAGSKEFKIARFEEIVPLTHLDEVVERHFMVLHHSQSQSLTLRDPLKVNRAAELTSCRKLPTRTSLVIATSATVCLQVGVCLFTHVDNQPVQNIAIFGQNVHHGSPSLLPD